MSWGINPNAPKKEKIFAEFNDNLKGLNSADGLKYSHYSKIYDFGRELADEEYKQGRADERAELIDEFVKKHNACDTRLCDKVNSGMSCCECIAEQLRGADK